SAAYHPAPSYQGVFGRMTFLAAMRIVFIRAAGHDSRRSLMKVLGQSVAFAFFLAIGQAAAEYRFDVWTAADSGLPQNTVCTLLQSRDGYLWVGTLDGLARFDGVRFTVFNRGNSPGLPSNRITALYENAAGDLWAGTEGGGLTVRRA